MDQVPGQDIQTVNPQVIGGSSLNSAQSSLQGSSPNSFMQNNFNNPGTQLRVESSCSGNCSGSITTAPAATAHNSAAVWGVLVLIILTTLAVVFIKVKEMLERWQ